MKTQTNLKAMAWRNLWRNRRRTIITLISIAFGMMLAFLFTGLGDRGYADMIDVAARLGGGHVMVQAPGTLDAPSLKRVVPGSADIAKAALADPGVRRVQVRIQGQTMLGAGGERHGAMFLAIDPKSEDIESLSILEDLSEGELLESSNSRGILLGVKLAEKLRVGLGKKVVYTMTGKDGEIVAGLARVKGLLKTGSQALDAGLALLAIDRVRKTLGYAPQDAGLVALFLNDQRTTEESAARLQSSLGADVEVATWSQARPELAGFIDFKVSGTTMMEILLLFLIGAGIFNMLFVNVMERRREFGIMMALGFRPGHLFRLVMWESLFLAFAGIVAAALLTAVPYYLLSTHGINIAELMAGSGGAGADVAGVAMPPIMYVGIYLDHAIIITSVVVLATLVAGLYPAWRAGRVVPVETIKLV